MKKVTMVRHGTFGSPEGSEQWETFDTPGHSRLFCNAQAKFRSMPIFTALSVFNLPPGAAAAAGKDDLLLSLGTGTEVIARAAKGGVNVKTQATTPADNDNAMLIPVASSTMIVPVQAVSQAHFSTRVNLTQITELQFSAGLDENLTAVDPTATAGDGAKICFDPAQEITTGLTLAQHANWILSQKVAGTDTFLDSGVPVVAGVDYELEIVIGDDLKPIYYINGTAVGTGVALSATSPSLGVVVGVQINAATPAGQKDFDCRYVALERLIG